MKIPEDEIQILKRAENECYIQGTGSRMSILINIVIILKSSDVCNNYCLHNCQYSAFESGKGSIWGLYIRRIHLLGLKF